MFYVFLFFFSLACVDDSMFLDLIIHIVVLALIGLSPAFNTNLGLYHVIRFVQMERGGIEVWSHLTSTIYFTKGKRYFDTVLVYITF